MAHLLKNVKKLIPVLDELKLVEAMLKLVRTVQLLRREVALFLDLKRQLFEGGVKTADVLGVRMETAAGLLVLQRLLRHDYLHLSAVASRHVAQCAGLALVLPCRFLAH